MLSYAKVADKPRLLRALTGFDKEAFEKLARSFAEAYEEHLDELDRKREKPRQRRRGGGRKSAIPTIEDKLLFILVYFKIYPLQIVLGLLFGLSQPQANFWIHRLTPILNRALGYEMQLPARRPLDLEQVLSLCPALEGAGFKPALTATERRIRRPKDPDRQKQSYSGKKKCHTVKNVVVVERESGKIKGLSKTVEGKKHDKKAAEEAGFRFPKVASCGKTRDFRAMNPKGWNGFTGPTRNLLEAS